LRLRDDADFFPARFVTFLTRAGDWMCFADSAWVL